MSYDRFEFRGRRPLSVEVREDGAIRCVLGDERVRTKDWKKVPPTVALANLGTSPQAVASFVRKYGTLTITDYTAMIVTDSGNKQSDGELLEAEAGANAYVNSGVVNAAQNILCLAWRGDRVALGKIEEGASQTSLRVIPSLVRDPEMVLEATDLWQFICCTFAIDYIEGRTSVCANADCSTPYYVKKRKDQQYCSHRCAVAVNVQRFRDRQSENE
jgi:hypothetical protein